MPGSPFLQRSLPKFLLTFNESEIQTIVGDVTQALRAGLLTLGPITAAFEQQVAGLAGTRHAIATSSGTSALEVIFRGIGVGGRPVLIPTNTNYATLAAALAADANPVLYDGGLYPDLDSIMARCPDDAAALVVVHIGGYMTPEIERLMSFCRSRGIALVEDAAHAHGAHLDVHRAGSIGYAAAFSFFPTKVVTTAEGGAVATDDDALADRARVLRNQGKGPDGLNVDAGSSWRMSEMAAAVGRTLMASFDADHARRLDIMRQYELGLADLPGLTVVPWAGAAVPSGYKCLATVEPGMREPLRAALRQRGVQLAGEVYATPLHQQPVFRDLACARGDFGLAERFSRCHIALPLWRGLGDDDVAFVVESVAACSDELSRA